MPNRYIMAYPRKKTNLKIRNVAVILNNVVKTSRIFFP